MSQYRLSEKLRETLKKNQEEKQPQEGLIAFCTKQAQSGLSVIAHSLHANGALPDINYFCGPKFSAVFLREFP